VPIVDSLATWVKQAETMVDLRRLCGTQATRKGFYHKRPESDRINEVFSFYGLNRLRSDS
jgi:hypothetical protein